MMISLDEQANQRVGTGVIDSQPCRCMYRNKVSLVLDLKQNGSSVFSTTAQVVQPIFQPEIDSWYMAELTIPHKK